MQLTSNDFIQGNKIPSKFTCDGENAVPHLSWNGEPKETKSFALSVLDPDAPHGTFIHWLVVNIPRSVHEIRSASPAGSLQIENDFGQIDWGGPCPPSGEHRYYFTIYALDIEELENVEKENFLSIIEQHTLAKAELMGRYTRHH